MRKPALTEKVLRGLSVAVGNIEAGDLREFFADDKSGESDFVRAGEWLNQMYRWRADR